MFGGVSWCSGAQVGGELERVGEIGGELKRVEESWGRVGVNLCSVGDAWSWLKTVG